MSADAINLLSLIAVNARGVQRCRCMPSVRLVGHTPGFTRASSIHAISTRILYRISKIFNTDILDGDPSFKLSLLGRRARLEIYLHRSVFDFYAKQVRLEELKAKVSGKLYTWYLVSGAWARFRKSAPTVLLFTLSYVYVDCRILGLCTRDC